MARLTRRAGWNPTHCNARGDELTQSRMLKVRRTDTCIADLVNTRPIRLQHETIARSELHGGERLWFTCACTIFWETAVEHDMEQENVGRVGVFVDGNQRITSECPGP